MYSMPIRKLVTGVSLYIDKINEKQRYLAFISIFLLSFALFFGLSALFTLFTSGTKWAIGIIALIFSFMLTKDGASDSNIYTPTIKELHIRGFKILARSRFHALLVHYVLIGIILCLLMKLDMSNVLSTTGNIFFVSMFVSTIYYFVIFGLTSYDDSREYSSKTNFARTVLFILFWTLLAFLLRYVFGGISILRICFYVAVLIYCILSSRHLLYDYTDDDED